MPVSSFAPEYLELFKLAAQQEVLIPIGNEKRAIRMRFRINMLRRAMRIENHSLTTIANSVQFILTPEFHLRCVPADIDHLGPLKAAGISVPAHSPSPSGLSLPKVERADATEVVRKFLKSGENK